MPPKSRSILTPMEWRVLEGVARRESNAAIAGALGIAPGTVAQHTVAIYQKLRLPRGGNKRAAARAWYQREGWRHQREEGS